MSSWHIQEQEGFVLAWHGDGEPTFELPDLSAPEWPTLRVRRLVVDARAQDITENSVDLAHFEHVHGYDDVRMVQPLGRDGSTLHAIYAATRRTGPLGTPLMFTYRVEVHGLGVSRVHVDVDGLAQCELLGPPAPSMRSGPRCGWGLVCGCRGGCRAFGWWWMPWRPL